VVDQRSTVRRNASRLLGVLVGILLLLGFIGFVHTMMAAKSGKTTRQVQMVQIIRPPPPPPDQPPPPPPEKAPEQLPKDVPEPTPDQPDQAPDQPLGLDADGSAGGDAFGLAARRGGGDLIGGTGSAPFAWYTNRMRDAIKDRLAAAPCTKSAKGSVSTRVLVAADGRIKQIKLVAGTGNVQVDECVDKVLESMTTVGDAPPPGMPEQVNLRVVF
jgi:periplasmic protein TonB